VDWLVLGELVNAGDKGLTMEEVCVRLLGRKLTERELACPLGTHKRNSEGYLTSKCSIGAPD
jgi:hypothetical protein